MTGMIKGSGGGSSLDLSAVTAAAADVRTGKRFYNSSGVLAEGAAPEISGGNVVLAGNDIILPSGGILAGDKKIKWDANITGANIREGRYIFGVEGNYSGDIAQGSFNISSGGITSYTLTGFGNFTPRYMFLSARNISSGTIYSALLYYHSGDANGSGSHGGWVDENWGFGGGSLSRLDCTFGLNMLTIDISGCHDADSNQIYFAKGSYTYMLAG